MNIQHKRAKEYCLGLLFQVIITLKVSYHKKSNQLMTVVPMTFLLPLLSQITTTLLLIIVGLKIIKDVLFGTVN